MEPVKHRRIDRTKLLPRSGIGVGAPWLLIAPPGNPVIRLDARLLDRVELIGRSPTAPLVASGLATAGVAAAALSLVPGGVFACAGLAYLALERFSEAAAARAARICCSHSVISRSRCTSPMAPMPPSGSRKSSRHAMHRSAPRGLRGREAPHARPGRGQRRSGRARPEHALLVGNDVVFLRGDFLQVGSIAFRITEVREFALRGANLPLTGGRLLQAAMGLLVVAAEERARAGEDFELLSKRVADYEAWSGHHAGR